jgi:hypothetical protein
MDDDDDDDVVADGAAGAPHDPPTPDDMVPVPDVYDSELYAFGPRLDAIVHAPFVA